MNDNGSLQITEIDVFDDAALAACYDAHTAAEREGLGDLATIWTLAELTVALREPSRVRRHHLYVGTVDAVVVATGALTLPLLDNLDSATFSVNVVPSHRRRGFGTAMLTFVEARARDLGRPLLDTGINWTNEHGSDGAGWPGREFALAQGYRLTLGDVQRELALPVDDGLLDELAAEAAVRHDGYTVQSWVGAVPEVLALGYETLASSLMTEAPTGDREIEPEVVDVANLREREAVAAKQGRTMCCTVAITADGEVAAYTDLALTPHETGKAYQWGTLVRTADRGHRLGLAVKVANLRLLQSLGLGAERVVTWNAEVNSHMIGVNERLGFRPVARAGEFQKRLKP
ncbi:GNAT family N-acetyltransferase [soil metagenome]